MHATNILALILSVSLATGFYIPPRALAPRRADTHRELHSRQVVRDLDPAAPFINVDGSQIPGPVYGFPGDLIDPNTPTPPTAAPASKAPAAPEVPQVNTPISGNPAPADTPMPVSVPQPDSHMEAVVPSPVAPEVLAPSSEPQPAPVEPAPVPVEAIVAAPEVLARIAN